ncbi:MAG: hypothetical protein ACRDYF_16020 [Acidimicrobiia bacterium]
MRKLGWLTALLLLAATAAACGEDKGGNTQAAPPSSAAAPAPAPSEAINPADFSPQVDNPLFPVSSFNTLELSGTERDSKTGKTVEIREVTRRLDKTETIASVGVAVLEVKEYEDGQLVELTEDYFAQHRDGSVWYFGERVSDYKDGKVVGHGGQWLAGEGDNLPGLYMPANPAVGQEFEPERVAGVAEERFKVVEVGLEVAVPAGRYTGCIKVEEFDIPDKMTEYKFHCPRVGTVRAEGPNGTAELVQFS